MSSRFLLAEGAQRPGGVTKAHWDAFKEGMKCLDRAAMDIANAGKCFAEIRDADWLRLKHAAPGPIKRVLEYTRDVGKGKLLPQLATASGEYVSRLRSLPIELQEQFMREPVEIAVWRHRKWDKKSVFVPDMTPQEVRQAFRREGRKWQFRSIEEQRQWLKAEEKRLAQVEEKREAGNIDRPHRYAIRGRKVYFARKKIDNGVSVSDLWDALEDLGELEEQ